MCIRDRAYDVAFAAGTLTGFHESGSDVHEYIFGYLDEECVPASYSVQYHSNLTENMRKHALKRAKIKLHDVKKQFTNLTYLWYPCSTGPRVSGFEYWLQEDEPLCWAADDFFFDYKSLIDHCIELTEKKEKEEKATNTDTENRFERPLKSRIDDLISEKRASGTFWKNF